MKLAIITLITIALICAASAKQKYPPLGDFKTVSGKVYKNAKISKVAGDYISISHQEGLSRIYFNDIPKELSTKLGLSKATARAAEKEREEANLSLKRQRAEKLKDGPFGLWGGMSVNEANTIGSQRSVNKYNKFNSRSKPVLAPFPYTHSTTFKKLDPGRLTALFHKFYAYFDSEKGLVAIQTVGGVPTNISKNKYSEIIQSLTKKYGQTLVTKNEKVKVIITERDLVTTLWPTKSRPQGVWDISVSWLDQASSINGDQIKIEYWFVPKKSFLEQLATDQVNQKAADKLKGKDNLNDL